MDANLRYWQGVVRAAEADLDAVTTNSELKIAARRLMRARQQLAILLQDQPEAHASSRVPRQPRKRRPRKRS